MVDLDFKKSNDSVFIDVNNIPGEEIRDFCPFGDLRMLIVSYTGVISVTSSNEVISQMNLHLTKDEVTKALSLSKDEQYFCVSIKNTKPKVPSIRFYKMEDKGRSFVKLGVVDFTNEDLMRNEYSYFFAINFECSINNRPVLTAFQCCNEFRVYSFYVDEKDKIRKIGWKKTDCKKFVWDCKFHKGAVYALDRDLNLTIVKYKAKNLGKNKYEVEYDNRFKGLTEDEAEMGMDYQVEMRRNYKKLNREDMEIIRKENDDDDGNKEKEESERMRKGAFAQDGDSGGDGDGNERRERRHRSIGAFDPGDMNENQINRLP